MKENKIYTILRKLTDFTIPKEHRQVVREWLVGKDHAIEKEAVMKHLWNNTSAEKDATTKDAFENTWKKITASEQKISRKLFINKMLRYAAILLLPIISGVVVWTFSSKEHINPDMLECYVPNGERKTVLLPDGSLVQLNAGTLLIYPEKFTASKRQIYLYGEGNFTIEKQTAPFIVKAGILNIEVLGTKFNVEAYPGSHFIATTLENGSVKVYKEAHTNHAITLTPNEQLIYAADENRFVINKVDASDYSAWINGELRFINKTLDEILFTLERKYDVKFLVDTEIKGSDLFTMKFKSHETIEDALFVVGEIMETITYKREGQTIRLKLKRKEGAF